MPAECYNAILEYENLVGFIPKARYIIKVGTGNIKQKNFEPFAFFYKEKIDEATTLFKEITELLEIIEDRRLR